MLTKLNSRFFTTAISVAAMTVGMIVAQPTQRVSAQVSPNGRVIFYNGNNGYGVVGNFDAYGNFIGTKSYSPPGSLTPGFTQIAHTPLGLLFYRAGDGYTVLGNFDGNGNFIAIKSFSLTPGFTLIVDTSEGILFYRADNGYSVVGNFDGNGNFIPSKSYSLTPGFTTITKY